MIGFAEFSRRCNVSALLRYFADIIAYPVERLCRCVSRPPVARARRVQYASKDNNG
jgi:hypothetical protein